MTVFLKKVSLLFLISGLIFPQTLFAYTPTDPEFSQQKYLSQISAQQAWDVQAKADKVVVAVIDTGVDIDNPELFNSVWINTKEIPDNRIDDDANGYVDDVNGWDFVNNHNNPRPVFSSDITKIGVSHGTVVAGLIAAEHNNGIGVSGLAPGVKIMALRALSSKGDGSFDDVIAAIDYAINNGAKIINLSMVSDKTYDDFEYVIKTAVEKGIMIVSAAGNETESTYLNDTSINLNNQLRYPICSNNGVGVVGVGSVNSKDIKSSFSNYGSSCLDVSVPGEQFISVIPFNPSLEEYRKYTGGYFTGTSVSAPLVSATAALIWARNPDLSAKEVEKIIIETGDDINSLNASHVGQIGKRLNVYKALLAVKSAIVKNKFITSVVSGGQPWVYIFSEDGKLVKEFLAYDKKFTGGVRITTADINNDGQIEIITVPGFGGGPHVRIFNLNGEVIGQFMVADGKTASGLSVTVVEKDQQKMLAVLNQNSKQPQVMFYSFDGKLLTSFNLSKQTFNYSPWIYQFNNNNEIVVADFSDTIKRYSSAGKFLGEWKLPFNQKDLTDIYSIDHGKYLVVSDKVKSYIYDVNGTLIKVANKGLVQIIDNVFSLSQRSQEQFTVYNNDVMSVDVKTDKVNFPIGNLRLISD